MPPVFAVPLAAHLASFVVPEPSAASLAASLAVPEPSAASLAASLDVLPPKRPLPPRPRLRQPRARRPTPRGLPRRTAAVFLFDYEDPDELGRPRAIPSMPADFLRLGHHRHYSTPNSRRLD